MWLLLNLSLLRVNRSQCNFVSVGALRSCDSKPAVSWQYESLSSCSCGRNANAAFVLLLLLLLLLLVPMLVVPMLVVLLLLLVVVLWAPLCGSALM
jgi:hypothetical protein